MGANAADVEADFCAFVAGRQAALRNSAWLLTGDAGLAEDLVQVALVKSWPHWHKLLGSNGAEAYVRRTMVTTYSSWWRRKWRREVPGDLPEQPSPGVDVAVTESVRRALLSLPPGMRAAVVLRYFDDLTEVQTAQALGCSVGNVKSQTARALEKLRGHPGLADLLTEGATS